MSLKSATHKRGWDFKKLTTLWSFDVNRVLLISCGTVSTACKKHVIMGDNEK